jgi:hypothetical protein
MSLGSLPSAALCLGSPRTEQCRIVCLLLSSDCQVTRAEAAAGPKSWWCPNIIRFLDSWILLNFLFLLLDLEPERTHDVLPRFVPQSVILPHAVCCCCVLISLDPNVCGLLPTINFGQLFISCLSAVQTLPGYQTPTEP